MQLKYKWIAGFAILALSQVACVQNGFDGP